MVLLAEFNVIKPEFGLFFWTVLIFLSLWFFLGKKAFTPIANALKEREDSIKDALAQADIARNEMNNLKAENEQLIAQAREEKAAMLKEAKENAAQIVSDAKSKAKEEAGRILANANLEIENQKKAAISELKGQVGLLAVQVAESVIKKQLSNDPSQIELAKSLANEIKMN
ncbi:MAG TPA: F0F1 ATP synthase subunit B [Saprospiraceae bacterium]|jgi:F-type H+-transporting ATPase subunit b|nr:F0F1 ATP synthase subunit B [Candidatus Parvibacillus calidus]MBX2937802.1 F0F1 ATP synthase subunit B [Saprospiraceae bacterium]MBX7179970.1 F0F1 ATP synthase subunit B [Saprospiraceae bacterium]MCB0590588.1 F0F1 ATP synthase subunit B [Saprospiraceae bacterium]MCC7148646.1 F0F1 ATP synthase subunit B [Saprospiraceae bacterium]